VSRDYRKIRAWQYADALAFATYEATREFPKTEAFGLTSQLRRAALSVATNIVEGSARQHGREYLQFLYVAFGSACETGYLLDFARRLGYLPERRCSDLQSQQESAVRTLRALINYIERSGPAIRCPKSRVHSPESQGISERSPHV